MLTVKYKKNYYALLAGMVARFGGEWLRWQSASFDCNTLLDRANARDLELVI